MRVRSADDGAVAAPHRRRVQGVYRKQTPSKLKATEKQAISMLLCSADAAEGTGAELGKGNARQSAERHCRTD